MSFGAFSTRWRLFAPQLNTMIYLGKEALLQKVDDENN